MKAISTEDLRGFLMEVNDEIGSAHPEMRDTKISARLLRDILTELLANLEAKPVGYVSASTLNCLKSMQTHEIITAKPEKDAVSERDWDVIPVYTAPPAPAVPNEMPDAGYAVLSKACGDNACLFADELWNACRTAMLAPEGGN